MFDTEQDHCKIVLDGLTGEKAVDEQTFSSIDILTERLDNVRKLHQSFINVEFSPYLSELVQQELKLAVS